ncbi:MAG: winged helix-turn-helix transcriptional regulator [Leptospiraceae bacterium]|nr:winged helix-turn-helix transcriptional regulator [Leptospiraceae bacterium]
MACTFFNTRKSSRILSRLYDRAFTRAGIKGTQFSLLATVCYYNGQTITSIAHQAIIDRTTLSRNLAVLEKQGLIIVRDSEDPGNQKKVEITHAGEAVLEKSLEVWQEIHETIQDRMGPQNWRQLIRLLLTLQREFEHSDDMQPW